MPKRPTDKPKSRFKNRLAIILKQILRRKSEEFGSAMYATSSLFPLYFSLNYILSGTSIPSNPMPKRMILATLAESTRRKRFTASSSSRRML